MNEFNIEKFWKKKIFLGRNFALATGKKITVNDLKLHVKKRYIDGLQRHF